MRSLFHSKLSFVGSLFQLLGCQRRLYIVLSFRVLYGFMFACIIYIPVTNGSAQGPLNLLKVCSHFNVHQNTHQVESNPMCIGYALIMFTLYTFWNVRAIGMYIHYNYCTTSSKVVCWCRGVLFCRCFMFSCIQLCLKYRRDSRREDSRWLRRHVAKI